MEDEFLQRINLNTAKEAWDTLATIFTRKTDAKLQFLENELMSVQQRGHGGEPIFYKSKIHLQ